MTIEPGVNLKFNSGCYLRIGNSSGAPGALIAQGTSDNKIVFTRSGTSGNWEYIHFENTTHDNTSILENCEIAYARSHAVYIYQSNPTIKNSIIRNTNGVGLYLNNSSASIIDNEIKNNSSYGVQTYSSSSSITGNTFTENGNYDLYFQSSANCTVSGNTINNGIYSDPHIPGNFTSNIINHRNDRPLTVHPNDLETLLSENTFNGLSSDSVFNIYAGTISKDTVWKSSIKYKVTGSIRVQGTDGSDGVTTLTIEPGVNLKFNSGCYLRIGNSSGAPGALIAQGTSDNKIIFTRSGTSGNWEYIHFENTTHDNTSILENCEIAYARSYAVYIHQSNPTIKNSIIRNTSGYGLYAISAAPIITGNTFTDNSNYDLYLQSSRSSTISGNTINNGVYADPSVPWKFTSNIINYRNDRPLRMHPNDIGVIVPQNTFNNLDGNSFFEIADGTVTHDKRFTALIPYKVIGGIRVQGTDGSDGVTTLTIEPGVNLKFNSGCYLRIGNSSGDPGALIAQGTSDNKIVFTRSASTGNWPGINFEDTTKDSLSLIEHCIFEYAGNNIYLYNASPVIQYNTIQKASSQGINVYGAGSNNAVINCNVIQNNPNGIYLNNAYPTIQGNNFLQNANYAVYNAGSASVTAENNWWNDENGPGFNGEEKYGNVDFTPWLTGASACVNNDGTNRAPFAASHPTPENAAVNVATPDQAVTAKWLGSDPNYGDALVYDVFFGNSAESLALVSENQTGSQFVFTSLLPGNTYFWQVTTKDAAGESTPGPVWQFTTGGLPPDLMINQVTWTPVDNLQAGQDITFAVTVKNIGTGPCVDPFQVVLRIDGAVVKTWDNSSLIPVEGMVDFSGVWTATTGDHTIEVEADSGKIVLELNEDNNVLSQSITGIQDPEPPSLVSTFPAGSSFSQAVDHITITLADAHGQVDDAAVMASVVVKNQLDQVVAGTVTENNDVFTFTPDVAPFAQGVYSVSVVAKDAWGNTQGYTFSFTVDTDVPAVPAITGGMIFTGVIKVRPASNRSATANISITGTREDDTKVWVNGVEKTGFGSGDWSVSVVLAQGDNTFDISLEDRAGNRGDSVFIDIVLDSLAPVISGVTPADNVFLNAPPASIVVDYTETTSEVDMAASILSVKDKMLTPVAGNWADTGGTRLVFTPTAPFVESIFQVEIRLQDTMGNQGIAKMTHFTVDLTRPPALVIDPVTTPSQSNTQMIKGTKEAYAAVWMNGAQVVGHTDQTAWEYLVPLVSGQNTFAFKAVDRAGNESDPVSVDIFFDDTPPLAVDSLSINPDGNGTSVMLNWTEYDESVHGDIAAYRIYAQPSTFSSVAGLTPYATIEAGYFEAKVEGLTRNTPYFFAVVALDDAGNALETVTPVTATPKDINPPLDVTNLSVQCFEDRLILNWQHSANTDGDLLKYKVYVNGEPDGVEVDATINQLEKTGLAPATAYDFKVTSVDADNNESGGAGFQGITLLANPANVTTLPYSGYVKLSWEMSAPPAYVKQYRIYVSDTPFTSVDGMTPGRTATGLSASISGLTNDTLYYFAVTAVNLSAGEQ
ncbi:MAG: right-handed parallel beta-helix repeat-containing protein, partial [Pseudomonadota bacterium]